MKSPEEMIQAQIDAERLLEATLKRMNGRVLGLTLGGLASIGLFVATNWLVLRGSKRDDVGAHLGLLCHYLPGYAVSFLGSLIGAAWAFVIGFVAGNVVSRVYNRVAASRR